MPWYRQITQSLGQPIDHATEAHRSPRMLKAITIRLDAAPTTSEDLVVALDSALGVLFDVTIYTLDLSIGGTTAILLTDINLPFSRDDALQVTYANTDAASIGIQAYFSDWWA